MATGSSSAAERALALRQRPRVKRLARFVVAAGAVQGTYTAVMAVGLLLLHGPRQAVLLVAFVLQLIVHFSLNRQWVFDPRHTATESAPHAQYGLALGAHGIRYVTLAAGVYGVTALSLAVLPGALGISSFVAWFLTSATIGVLNFFLLGRVVFR
jgi:putative flippase GtrA